jgi:hypothetical protein
MRSKPLIALATVAAANVPTGAAFASYWVA